MYMYQRISNKHIYHIRIYILYIHIIYIYNQLSISQISNIDRKGTLSIANIFTASFQSPIPSAKTGGFDSDQRKVIFTDEEHL